jgi:hypothetical protein
MSNTISGAANLPSSATDGVTVYCTPVRGGGTGTLSVNTSNFSFPGLSPGTYIISAVPNPLFPAICLLSQAVPNTAQTLTLSSVAVGSGGTAVYTGTITGGGGNAFAGYQFVVAGFTNANNNGTFFCTGSTATTLTLSNAFSPGETHAATATSVATNTGYIGNLGANAVNNQILGVSPVISGFVHNQNNGSFAVTSSSATGFAVANAGVAETTGSAQVVLSQYAGWTFLRSKTVVIDPSNPQDQTGVSLEPTPPGTLIANAF